MLIPVLLLIGVGIVLHHSHRSLLASSGWVSHTLNVESKLSSLHSLIAEAESAQRGFLITGNQEYLDPLAALSAEIPAAQQDLAALTADNPSQQQRLKKLAAVVAEKTALIQGNIELIRAGQRDEAIKIVNAGRGRQLMIEIRGLLADASAEEEGLLHTRQSALAQRSTLHANVTYVLIALAGLAVLGVLLLLRYFQRCQALITMCAWSKTIEHEGEWLSFEDYLQKRFGFNISHGISPEEAAKFTQTLATRRKHAA
ncbi:MAG: CHASE3 domain-containing protein [Chthoniobacter sp.]